jgi:pimeloyl-ACP methyl ester carboxylesterase
MAERLKQPYSTPINSPMLHHKVPAFASLAACLFCATSVHAGVLAGKIFHVDVTNRRFELLKETEYDPKTDMGRSRLTVHWTEQTTIRKVEEKTSFAGIKGPILAEFRGIDAANMKAVREGKPFIARVATLSGGVNPATEPVIAENQVTAWFTPDDGDTRSGHIQLEGSQVAVSLRARNWQIIRHQPVQPAELADGFWQATLTGSETDGRFVIQHMDVTPLPDPRATDDPKLPRVLVIGDSISMNYHESARAALAGFANCHRNEGNAASSAHGVRNTELWLGDYREKGFHWDVIQFNHGLHDLKQTYDAKTDTWGEYSVPLAAYKANLEKEIAILRRTGAKLIWCATTPVPNDNKSTYARRKGASKIFNDAALEVIRRHPDILVTDLHAVVDGSPVFDKWRQQNDVHFYQKEERKLLGEAVAATIRKALERSPKNLPLPGETFTVEGRPAFLMLPKRRDVSKPIPWVWYAPTLPNLPGREEAWMFVQLLSNGIAVAGVDVGESMGNPAGRALFTAFHKEMRTRRGMSAKPCLLARSRGGLMHYNWAAENPDCVAAIAGIYPVGNLASWPGLPRACKAYGLTEAGLAGVLPGHNPIDRLAPLAKAGVPLMHIHGDNDTVVPLENNSGLVKQRYDPLGGQMILEVVQGGGHDMKHHWFQSRTLVDFMMRHARQGKPSP